MSNPLDFANHPGPDAETNEWLNAPLGQRDEVWAISSLGDSAVWLLHHDWSLDRVLSQVQLAAVQEFSDEGAS